MKKFTSIDEINNLNNNFFKPQIAIVGIGGAGTNAVNNMINMGLSGVKFIVVNTDMQSLDKSVCPNKLQIGAKVTKGLGAGSRPEIGVQAAEESIEEIKTNLKDVNMLFITCGMGGGTGTGASQVIAKVAKDMGILTVAFVTRPFDFEGSQRIDIASLGIAELEKFVDSLVVIANQNLFKVIDSRTSILDAFKVTDSVLFSGVKAVTDLLVSSGLVNLDFNDVKSVLENMGRAMIGAAETEGEDRAELVARASIENPLLEDVSIKGAKKALINITGGDGMTLFEVDTIINIIKQELSPEAFINFGTVYDSEMDTKIRVSVLATGLDKNATTNQLFTPHIEEKISLTIEEHMESRKNTSLFSNTFNKHYTKELNFVTTHHIEETEDVEIPQAEQDSTEIFNPPAIPDYPKDVFINNFSAKGGLARDINSEQEFEDTLQAERRLDEAHKQQMASNTIDDKQEFFEENGKIDLFDLIARKNQYEKDAKKVNQIQENEILNIKNRDKIDKLTKESNKNNKSTTQTTDSSFFDLPSFLKKK